MADVTRRGPAARQPITSHPLFPPIVVLWVGALFGLASVAIAPTAIESIVRAAGIDRVIPMAAPPLGTTFRILLALLFTGLGCVVGFLVARRIATTPTEAAPRRRRPARVAEDASPIAMFGAHGDDSDEEEPRPLRRRQFAATVAQDTFDDHAPLPGGAQILNVADLDLDGYEDGADHARVTPAQPAPAAEYDPFVSDAHYEDHPESPAGIFDRPLSRPSERADEAAEPTSRGNRLFDAYVRGKRVDPTVEVDIPAPGFTILPRSDDGDAMPLAEAVEPNETELSALGTEAVTVPLADSASEPESEAQGESEIAAKNGEASALRRGYANAAERISTGPLGDLSHVELLERLALALQRRRIADAAARATVTIDAEATVPSARSRSGFDGMTAAAQPTALDEDGALSASVPPRRFTLSAIPSYVSDFGEDDEDVLAEGYSSLRNLTRAPGGHTVQHMPAEAVASADPVIAFPSLSHAEPAQAPQPSSSRAAASAGAFDPPALARADSDDTERALRAALATLQRMSGAA